MKFTSFAFAALTLLAAGGAYAGSDDGTNDVHDPIQSAAVVQAAPAPAAAAAQQAADYSHFEQQVVQP
ncbi:MAG TPA: hypothetical protein VGN52_17690 [Burkholderiales bacterium]